MKNNLMKTVALSALLVSPFTWAEPLNPMASGQAMSWQCAPCHGTNGQEFNEAMPPLAGMPKQQFVTAMIAYREGTRAAIIMDRVARGFTDAEIDAMAIWFEKQPVKSWDNTSLVEAYAASDNPSAQGEVK